MLGRVVAGCWDGIAAVLVWTVAASVAQADVAAPRISTDAELHQLLVERIDVQHRGTGAIIEIVSSGGRRAVAYGSLAAGGNLPVTDNTVFGLQSVTKVFTALLLADMVRRHELAVADPASRHLPPSVHLPTREGREISLADLATHTSGLPLRPSNLVSADTENKYDGYTPELLYRFLSGYQLHQTPGTHYEYSNVGFGLLGQALSYTSGKSYAQLLRERITLPLNLTRTRLDLTAEMRRRSAVGYTTEARVIPDRERGALDAAGALHSTASDLSTLLEVALGYRKSPEIAADIAITLGTRRPGGQMPSTQTALGWNVLAVGQEEIVYKNGAGGGFRTFIGYNRASGVGVVGLINVESDVGVDDIALNFLGAGTPVSDTDILTVSREGDRLYCQEEDQPRMELHPEGERDFFLKEIDAQVTFESTRTVIWHQWGQDQRGERMR